MSTHWTIRKIGKAWFAHDGAPIPTYYYGAPSWVEVLVWRRHVRRVPLEPENRIVRQIRP